MVMSSDKDDGLNTTHARYCTSGTVVLDNENEPVSWAKEGYHLCVVSITS